MSQLDEIKKELGDLTMEVAKLRVGQLGLKLGLTKSAAAHARDTAALCRLVSEGNGQPPLLSRVAALEARSKADRTHAASDAADTRQRWQHSLMLWLALLGAYSGLALALIK